MTIDVMLSLEHMMLTRMSGEFYDDVNDDTRDSGCLVVTLPGGE